MWEARLATLLLLWRLASPQAHTSSPMSEPTPEAWSLLPPAYYQVACGSSRYPSALFRC